MMTTAGFADREQGKRCLSRHHIGGSRPAARWLLWGRMVTNCWRRHCRIEPKGVTRTQQSGGLVARAGIDRPEVTLPLLAGLTPRWSSEGAVRPFIQRHPDLTYEHLHRWVADRDEHVRRLVSEGTRPRLPWASQLRQLMADPTPNIELLDRLDDPSEYVRRSVANHLNVISKDHPDLAVDLARRWLPRGDGAAWAVRHGLRTLVKRGDPTALELLGVTPSASIRLTALAANPDRAPVGGTVTCTLTIELTTARRPRRSSTTGSTTSAPTVGANPRSSN
jgi:3-methyladenine DNA glycosylase AlkC